MRSSLFITGALILGSTVLCAQQNNAVPASASSSAAPAAAAPAAAASGAPAEKTTASPDPLALREVPGSAGFISHDSPFPFDNEPWFPKVSYFKRRFTTVNPRVELAPPVRIADRVVGGKLELSLKDYLDLVMANNPDISVQKLSVEVQKNAIQRAFAPFDPNAFASFNATRQVSPGRPLLLDGNLLPGSASNILTQPFSMRYNQLLPNGTSYNVQFANTRISSGSYTSYNPSQATSLTMNISQPLLRGRGTYFNKLPITIARGRLKAGIYSVEDAIIQLVTNAETLYWNVIQARENLRVQEEALSLADTSLKRSQRELELGAISSLEIYQPQANYANAEIFVTQARFQLQQAEDALRRQMGADQDPKLRDLPIVLTESVTPPADQPLDKEGLVQRALARRPDLRNQNENLANDDLVIRQANNALLPDLSLTAQYASFGQGGPLYSNGRLVSNGGFIDGFSDVWGFGYPTYGFGLTLRLPIKDRAASANMADAIVNKRIDTLRVKSTMQTIRLQVLQAINNVENSKASVQLAKIARDLAQKRVDAEQKRYELGTTTIFFVLSAQNDLTTAESSLVRESINYRRNLLTLMQRTGEYLDERGIQIQLQ